MYEAFSCLMPSTTLHLSLKKSFYGFRSIWIYTCLFLWSFPSSVLSVPALPAIILEWSLITLGVTPPHPYNLAWSSWHQRGLRSPVVQSSLSVFLKAHVTTVTHLQLIWVFNACLSHDTRTSEGYMETVHLLFNTIVFCSWNTADS